MSKFTFLFNVQLTHRQQETNDVLCHHGCFSKALMRSFCKSMKTRVKNGGERPPYCENAWTSFPFLPSPRKEKKQRDKTRKKMEMLMLEGENNTLTLSPH